MWLGLGTAPNTAWIAGLGSNLVPYTIALIRANFSLYQIRIPTSVGGVQAELAVQSVPEIRQRVEPSPAGSHNSLCPVGRPASDVLRFSRLAHRSLPSTRKVPSALSRILRRFDEGIRKMPADEGEQSVH